MRISDWSSDVCSSDLVAPLGVAFYRGTAFPSRYRSGVFVSEHGSWNRSTFAGYRVVFVPFVDGRPSAAPEDFLSGFIADAGENQVHGRPVGIAVANDGALLVADATDRKSVVSGKRGSVRVDLGGRSIITKKKKQNTTN